MHARFIARHVALASLAVVAVACGGGGARGLAGGGGAAASTFFDAPVRVDRPPAGPHSVNGSAMCCQGQAVYVAYSDAARGEVRFNRSVDGGRTWMDPDVLVATAAAGTMQIACSGANVYVGWNDGEFKLAGSANSGGAWATKQLSGGNGYISDFDFVCEGSTVYATWTEFLGAKSDHVRFNRSTDSGATWAPTPTLIDSVPDVKQNDAALPRIALGGPGRLVIVHLDVRAGVEGLWSNASPNGGLSWDGDVQIDSTPQPSTKDPYRVHLASSGSNVFAVWRTTDRPAGMAWTSEIRSNASPTGGGSWFAADAYVSDGGGGILSNPRTEGLCADLNRAHFAWTTDDSDLVYSRTLTGGATWTSVPISSGPAGSVTSGPDLACSGDSVYATFVDKRTGPAPYDVRFAVSRDAGASWDDSKILSTDGALYSRVVCDGSDVYVLWAPITTTELFLNASHP